MLRLLSALIIALLLDALAAGSAQAQENLRGRLKKIDVANRVVVVTIEGTDHELALNPDTQVQGAQGKSQAEKLQALKEGGAVSIRTGERDGKRVVLTISSPEPGQRTQGTGGGAPQRAKVKSIDHEGRTITLAVGEQDSVLTLTDQTDIRGVRGETLADRLKGVKPGTDVRFVASDHDGKRVLIALVIGGGGNAQAVPGERGRVQTAPGKTPAEPGQGARPRAGSGSVPQRAKVKKIDVAERTVTLAVGERDVVLTLTDQTEVRGVRGETLTDRLQGIKPGTDVMFLAADRDGKKVLVGLALAGTMNAGGSDKPVSPNHAALKPLDELGVSKYQGYAGGLYPGGQNARPKEHEAAGLKLAAQVQPLDTAGKPDPAGKIVLLAVGMSNTFRSSEGFQSVLKDYDRKNPQLVFVNGAQGGMTASKIQNPDDGERGTMYWTEVDERLKQAGVTRAQVQAIWIKQADPAQNEGFPKYAKKLQTELMRIVQIFPQRFPNAKLVYFSSRIYGGFATASLNPEPYAYESGFSVKWLIEEQIKNDPALNCDASKGAVKSPWLSWGPYLWANGPNKRSADGLSWEQADFVEDGTHQSASGQRKVAQLLLDFFKSDSTTGRWFNRQ